MKNSLFFLAATLLPCAMVAASGSSAELCAQDSQVPTISVKVEEVVLPVTVRDKKGALVTTLKAGDFTLTEDGRPQTIKSFTTQSNLPFYVGMILDTSRSMDSSRTELRNAAGKFVDQMIPGTGPKPNQAFLLHFDKAVELLEDFTAKPGPLHKELDNLSATHVAKPKRSQDDEDEQVPPPDEQGGNQNGGYGGGRGQRGDDRGGYGAGQPRGGSALYDAVYLSADELMKSKSGRKALIVFSDGVDRGSKVSLTDAIDAADHANLSIYTIYFKGETERQGFGLPGQGGEHHGGGFPGGGGGGYPGGGGHHGGSGEPKPAIDGKKIMEQLANKTGGRFFEAKKKDNLDAIYAEISDELKSQYLLTYSPDKPDPDGGYHKVQLKTAKDDLKVFTREGYYATGK